MNPTFDQVVDALRGERTHQNQKWGDRNAQTSINGFVAVMEVYLAEVKALQAHHRHEDVLTASLDGLRKVTALGIAAMETHGVTTRAADGAGPDA